LHVKGVNVINTKPRVEQRIKNLEGGVSDAQNRVTAMLKTESSALINGR
jgi:hypothetical protein